MERAINSGEVFLFFVITAPSNRANKILFKKIYKRRLLVVVVVVVVVVVEIVEIVEHTIYIFRNFPLANHSPSTGQNSCLIIMLLLLLIMSVARNIGAILRFQNVS